MLHRTSRASGSGGCAVVCHFLGHYANRVEVWIHVVSFFFFFYFFQIQLISFSFYQEKKFVLISVNMFQQQRLPFFLQFMQHVHSTEVTFFLFIFVSTGQFQRL